MRCLSSFYVYNESNTDLCLHRRLYLTSCYQVEGEYDFLVKADVTSEKELEKLERGVRKINGVCSVQPVYALQEII